MRRPLQDEFVVCGLEIDLVVAADDLTVDGSVQLSILALEDLLVHVPVICLAHTILLACEALIRAILLIIPLLQKTLVTRHVGILEADGERVIQESLLGLFRECDLDLIVERDVLILRLLILIQQMRERHPLLLRGDSKKKVNMFSIFMRGSAEQKG